MGGTVGNLKGRVQAPIPRTSPRRISAHSKTAVHSTDVTRRNARRQANSDAGKLVPQNYPAN